jgi:hypothetical protein
MAEKGKGFGKAVNLSYVYAFVIYSTIATLGYFMFGENIKVGEF